MKQLIIIIVSIITTTTFGQINVDTVKQRRKAVIEEWYGFHCGYCPMSEVAIDQAIALHGAENIIHFKVHEGGWAIPGPGEPDFRTAEGDIHALGFGVNAYPHCTLNRRVIYGEQLYHPNTLNDSNKIPEVLQDSAEVNLFMTAEIDFTSRVLNVEVEYYYVDSAPSPINYL